MSDTFLWVEQYRPKDIESCILPVSLKSSLTDFINKGDVPNLILSGKSGVGKTTAAKANKVIANDINSEIIKLYDYFSSNYSCKSYIR